MTTKRRIAQRNLQLLLSDYTGERLPPERDLAEHLGVSRSLLRSLLDELATSGRLERRRGSGNYVIDHATESGLPTVALLVDHRLKLGDDPYFTRCLELLQAALQRRGSRCQLERIDGKNKPAIDAQGAITLGLAGQDVLEAWRPPDPPLVALFLNKNPRPSTRASVIRLDNAQAGEEAAHRLISQGVRHVLLIGRESIPDSLTRIQNAETALTKEGCRTERVECGMNYLDGFNLARGLNPDRITPRTALLVTNDWCAAGIRLGLAYQQSERLRKMLIISFDGLELAADPALRIESMAIPLAEIIEDTLNELQRLHAHPQLPGRVLTYPFL